MQADDIRADIRRLTSSAHSPLTEGEIWGQLRRWGAPVVPYLAEAYPATNDADGRAALVHHAIPYARVSSTAVGLGIEALADRSHKVRKQGCALLAYSLDEAAMPFLEALLRHPDLDTRDEAVAALRAIDARNHHVFRDRDRSGKVFWIVNPEDRPGTTPAAAGGSRRSRLGRWLFPSA